MCLEPLDAMEVIIEDDPATLPAKEDLQSDFDKITQHIQKR